MTTCIERLLRDSRRKLTAADRKLADVLLADPRQAAFLSTNEVASLAAVHPTSAVRLARKLGFDGYPALRSTLQDDLVGNSDAADRVRKRVERLGGNNALRAFVNSEIRALEALPDQVPDARIASAARAVIHAKTTFLFGTGHSEVLARLMQIRLLRGGYSAVVLPLDSRETAALLMQAGKGDVLMLFSFFAAQPRIGKLARAARSIGATCVIVTDIPNRALLPGGDIVLAANRGLPGEARSLTVPMAICNTIMLQISKLDGGKMIRGLETLEAGRAGLE